MYLGVYPYDDARCKNYTSQICHQTWMKKHCPDMCSNITAISSPVESTNLTHQVKCKIYSINQ